MRNCIYNSFKPCKLRIFWNTLELSRHLIQCSEFSKLPRDKILRLFDNFEQGIFYIHIFDDIDIGTNLFCSSVISNKTNSTIRIELIDIFSKKQYCSISQILLPIFLLDEAASLQYLFCI